MATTCKWKNKVKKAGRHNCAMLHRITWHMNSSSFRGFPLATRDEHYIELVEKAEVKKATQM